MRVIPGVKAKALTVEQKREPGSYLLVAGALYCVTRRADVDLLRGSMLPVEDALTGVESTLTSAQVATARFIRGPELVVCPDFPPAA